MILVEKNNIGGRGRPYPRLAVRCSEDKFLANLDGDDLDSVVAQKRRGIQHACIVLKSRGPVAGHATPMGAWIFQGLNCTWHAQTVCPKQFTQAIAQNEAAMERLASNSRIKFALNMLVMHCLCNFPPLLTCASNNFGFRKLTTSFRVCKENVSALVPCGWNIVRTVSNATLGDATLVF